VPCLRLKCVCCAVGVVLSDWESVAARGLGNDSVHVPAVQRQPMLQDGGAWGGSLSSCRGLTCWV
jgi:hypothetical protein